MGQQVLQQVLVGPHLVQEQALLIKAPSSLASRLWKLLWQARAEKTALLGLLGQRAQQVQMQQLSLSGWRI